MKVWKRLFENWQLKISALAIATLLWIAVQSGKPYHYRMAHVPVRVTNSDAEWVVGAPPSPATVAVEFEGQFRDLLHLASAHPTLTIPVSDVKDTAAIYEMRRGWVDLGGANPSIVVGRITPDTARVSFDRLATRLVALRAQFRGKIADGYELAGPPVIDPPFVRASGAARRLAHMDSIMLPNIDVSGLRANDTVVLGIDTAAVGATITPRRARVMVPIRRKSAMTAPGGR